LLKLEIYCDDHPSLSIIIIIIIIIIKTYLYRIAASVLRKTAINTGPVHHRK